MFTVKRIVTGTDLSWYASRAEARAAMLVRELGGEELYLLHVLREAGCDVLVVSPDRLKGA